MGARHAGAPLARSHPFWQSEMSSTLYILAGASCSGKSTLLRAWQAGQFDLFGDEAAGGGSLSIAERRTIPVDIVAQFVGRASSVEAPPKNIVLHVDLDRKSTRLNSSHSSVSRMPSSA